MFKLTEAADLEKAGRSLGTFFAAQAGELEKSFTFHKTLGTHHDGLKDHHDAMHKGHTDRAAEHKAHADGLDDGDVHKAHFHKAHAHHTLLAGHHGAAAAHHDALAKAHHAHADALKIQVDSMKALSGEWGATAKADGPGGTTVDVGALAKGEGTLDARVNKLSEALMMKAFEALNNNPTIGEKIQEIVLSQVEKAVGGKLVPDKVRGAAPDMPQAITAIPRQGGAPIPKANVPMQFEKLFAVDEGE